MATPAFRASDRFGRRLRAGLRRGVGWLLGGGDASLAALRSGRIDPLTVRRVLVCRLNARLGNTLFLTPLLAELHRLLPHAAIDIAVSYPRAQKLLSGFPGLRRVFIIPHKPLREPGAFLAQVRELRAQRYDLAIDPNPNSTGGRLAVAFARATRRLGFVGPEQWARMTHGVPVPPGTQHEGLRPLLLLERIAGHPGKATLPARLHVPLTQLERQSGRELVRAVLDARGYAGRTRVVGFFASARGAKDLGADWWRAFWKALLELEADLAPVEFLPWEGEAPVDPRFAVLSCGSPREMVAAMAATTFFVSLDTGPMHLASATDTPTVGLFSRTDPKRFGPIKASDLALEVTGLTPDEVARCVSAQLRALGR